jgi:hypothetical protein
VAVRLPDFTSLGGVETGAVNVRPGDITPRYYGEDPEAAALARSGAALGTLGTGLQNFGTGLSRLQSEANLVNAALAQADLHTRLDRTKAAIAAETDPTKIDALYSQLQTHLDSSGELIADSGFRNLWKAKHTPEVTNVGLVAEARQRAVYADRFHASSNLKAEELVQKYAQSDDPAAREQARSDLATIYSTQALAGTLTQTQAQAAAHKANQAMILGRAQNLDAQNRPQEALAHVMEHQNQLEPDDLDRAVKALRGPVRRQRGEDLGRAVATGGRTDFGGPVGPPPGGPVDPAQFTAEATSQGVDPALVHATADIESSYGKNTGNKISPSNTGIFQRAPADKPGGMNDSYENQIKLGVGDLVKERDGLRNSLGREPTNAEVYLAHQQGVSGATKLLNNPNTPAGQLVPAVNISNNAGDPSKPASAFVQHWKQAYDRREAPFRGIQAETPGRATDETLPAAAVLPPASHVGPPTLEEQFATIDATPGYSDEEKDIAKVRAQHIDSQRRVAMRGEIATVKKLMGDDLASLEQTGQAIPELTYDRVNASYGPEVADNWQTERNLAQNFYEQTSDFAQLPTFDLNQRLDQLRTAGAGQPGFAQRQRLYLQAEQKARQIEQVRLTDPATAVARFPEVMAASQGADLNRPETYQPLVLARMKAMDSLGLPFDAQIPITRQEATLMWRPIGEALRNGNERLARQEVEKTVRYLETGWGGQDTKALGFVLAVGHANERTHDMAASALKALAKSHEPTPAQLRAIDDARVGRGVAEAFGGMAPPSYPAPRPGETYLGQPLTGMVPGPPRPGQGTADFTPGGAYAPPVAGPPAPSYPVPIPAHIKNLRQHPETANYFDAVYGHGAAMRVLGIAPPLIPAATP